MCIEQPQRYKCYSAAGPYSRIQTWPRSYKLAVPTLHFWGAQPVATVSPSPSWITEGHISSRVPPAKATQPSEQRGKADWKLWGVAKAEYDSAGQSYATYTRRREKHGEIIYLCVQEGQPVRCNIGRNSAPGRRPELRSPSAPQ